MYNPDTRALLTECNRVFGERGVPALHGTA